MIILDSERKEKVDSLLSRGSEKYDEGKLTVAISMLKMAWDLLPSPKEKYDESYWIAYYIVKISLELSYFDQALEWAYIVSKCDPERADSGEKEFLIGQAEFEIGNMEVAKQYFRIAQQKSEGRIFVNKDPKYKKSISW